MKITSVLMSSIRPTCGDHQVRTGKNHSPRVRRSLTSCRMRRISRALRTARTWPSKAGGRGTLSRDVARRSRGAPPPRALKLYFIHLHALHISYIHYTFLQTSFYLLKFDARTAKDNGRDRKEMFFLLSNRESETDIERLSQPARIK